MKLLKDMAYELYENYLVLKTKVLDIVEGMPAVILIGEKHSDAYHPRIEARIIEEYKSEFVLLEGFDSSAEAQKILAECITNSSLYRRYLKMSLKDIGKRYGIDLGALLKPYSSAANLLDKPLCDLKPEERFDAEMYILEAIVEISVKACAFEIQNKVETSWLTDLKKLEMIEKDINAIWQYKDKLPVFEAIRKVGATAVGCDVDLSKAPRLNPMSSTDHLNELHNFAMSLERESTMARSIKKYAEKTARPVVAIVGKKHLRRNSKLLEELEKSELKYRAIKLPGIEKSDVNDLLFLMYLANTLSE